VKLGQVAGIMGSNWQTSDLWLAAYLRCRGHKILTVTCERGRVTMSFENVVALNETVRGFYDQTAAVEPLEYRAQIGQVRDMIGAVNRGEGGWNGSGNGNGKTG